MTHSRQSPWKRVLRELRREFTVLERELSLLQDIDQSILNIGVEGHVRRLEGLFVDTIDRFSKIHQTESPLLCYISLGSDFSLLFDESKEPNHPKTIRISKSFKALAYQRDPNPMNVSVVAEEEDKVLFSYFPQKKTILLYPMFSGLNQLICVFLVTDTKPKELSHLSEPTFGNSVLALVSQLAIAYNHHDRALAHRKIDELWSIFVQSDLSPTKCFKEMARRIPEFLPDFGSIRFNGQGPEVQILMLSRDPEPGARDPEELVIRGTTGMEYEGTRIAINRSISGLLIKSARLPYFCDDPTKPEYKKLYREYLGKEIRTELVVRLVVAGKTVGVLNLESETPMAFNNHHISAILRLAETIAPVLMVFERRLEMNSGMQLSVASSTARYLSGLASVYRHSLTTPLATLRSNIEMASAVVLQDAVKVMQRARALSEKPNQPKFISSMDELGQTLEETKEIFGLLSDTQSEISTYTEDFVADIDKYAESGPTDLMATLKAAVRLVNESIIQGKPIRINFGPDTANEPPIIFASRLLKQHLYSIFHNSVRAIEARRLLDSSRPGIILISVMEESPPSSQEVLLNKSWVVSIRDNGQGVTEEQLSDLNRFELGTRFREDPGQGYGLVAAQRYIASIGGRIKLNSEFGSFFEVVLHFAREETTDKRHLLVEDQLKGKVTNGH
jgi:signal transduction histidine kinase